MLRIWGALLLAFVRDQHLMRKSRLPSRPGFTLSVATDYAVLRRYQPAQEQ